MTTPPQAYDPKNPNTQMINGKLYVWQPATAADPTNQQSTYGGADDSPIDTTPGSGQGSWVPASYKNPNGVNPLKMIALMAAAGALGSGAVAGLGALGGGAGAAGASAAGAGGAGAAGAGAGAGAAGLGVTSGIAGGVLPGAAVGIPSAAGLGAGAAGAAAGGAGMAGTGSAGTLSSLMKYYDTAKKASALAGDVGTVMGKQAAGAASGRQVEDALLDNRDRSATSLYGTQQDAQNKAATTDLERKKFLETARMSRAQQAAMGDAFSHYSPVSIDVPGIQSAKISGGLSLGQGGKDAMLELLKQARMAQNTPDTFTGGEAVPPPVLSTAPKAGAGESFLGTAGSIAQILGAVGSSMEDPSKRKVYNTTGGL